MCQKDYNKKNQERKYQYLNYVEKTLKICYSSNIE